MIFMIFHINLSPQLCTFWHTIQEWLVIRVMAHEHFCHVVHAEHVGAPEAHRVSKYLLSIGHVGMLCRSFKFFLFLMLKKGAKP